MTRTLWMATAAMLWVFSPGFAAQNTAPAKSDASGTTVIGDGEAPMGLDITPWQHANRDDLARAPLLLDGRAEPASPSILREQMRDYMAIHGAHRVDME